ncbi:Uncharacterised protein [Hafnia alvei]|nr:Uncharacterised protein [Hafnia alvei]
MFSDKTVKFLVNASVGVASAESLNMDSAQEPERTRST